MNRAMTEADRQFWLDRIQDLKAKLVAEEADYGVMVYVEDKEKRGRACDLNFLEFYALDREIANYPITWSLTAFPD